MKIYIRSKSPFGGYVADDRASGCGGTRTSTGSKSPFGGYVADDNQ